jgi:hypothetical protein
MLESFCEQYCDQSFLVQSQFVVPSTPLAVGIFHWNVEARTGKLTRVPVIGVRHLLKDLWTKSFPDCDFCMDDEPDYNSSAEFEAHGYEAGGRYCDTEFLYLDPETLCVGKTGEHCEYSVSCEGQKAAHIVRLRFLTTPDAEVDQRTLTKKATAHWVRYRKDCEEAFKAGAAMPIDNVEEDAQ